MLFVGGMSETQPQDYWSAVQTRPIQHIFLIQGLGQFHKRIE